MGLFGHAEGFAGGGSMERIMLQLVVTINREEDNLFCDVRLISIGVAWNTGMFDGLRGSVGVALRNG